MKLQLIEKKPIDDVLQWYGVFLRDIKLFVKALYRWKVLSAKQEELLDLDHEINVILAGRRFGKSSLMAAKVFYFALTHPNVSCLVVGPSLEQSKIYFDLLVSSLEGHPFSVFVKGIKQSPFPEITLINDSKLLFRSTAFKGRYLRGKKIHYVVVTEAAFIDEEVFEQVIMPMRLDTRAKLYLESTPFGHNYFYRFYMQGLYDNDFVKSFHATVYDNFALPRDEIERQRLRTPQFVWRVEYLAEFVDDENVVFSHELLQKVFEDYTPAGLVKGHKYVIGLDIAQKEDYTVFVVLDITHVPYVIADYRRFNKRGFDDIIVLANELSSVYNAPVYVDSTAIGKPVADGIKNAVQIHFTSRMKNDLIDNLLLHMEQGKIKLPASNTIIRDELRYFRRDLGSHYHRVPTYDSPRYHDDSVIALALAVWGASNSMVGSFSIDLF